MLHDRPGTVANGNAPIRERREMIRIDPTALYSRSDLEAMLRPLGIDSDGFVARLKPRKRFRLVWFGEDLLEAIRRAPELSEPVPIPAPKNRGGRRRTARKDSEGNLLGGIFSAGDIGLETANEDRA